MISNSSGNETIHDVVAGRLSRRAVLGGGLAAGATALFGVDALLRAVPVGAAGGNAGPLLGFQSVPVSLSDTLVVPPGYTAKVLIAWGDPISNGPAFAPDASNSAADQEQQWGMHNDGVVFFPMHANGTYGGRAKGRGLLVQNHEYTDDVLLFTDGTAGWNAAKTAKSLAAHGVSVIELQRVKIDRRGRATPCDENEPDDAQRRDGLRREWRIVRPSGYARRITGTTPIRIAGPAAGDPRMKTSADRTGTLALGTLNNCAMGFTPWGTYLACEENFNGYFRKNDTQTQPERRYGINAAGFGYLWHTTDSRFQVDTEPNEPNRFGWVTEIDPFTPGSTPVKRTALGRIKHEGAWVQEARDGRVVVYSGDDEQFEYIYRFVSADRWRTMLKNGESPLDRGTLYVAKFHSDTTPDGQGLGEWIALTPDHPALAGWSLADILINTRTAADLVGATPMDRPEWIDTFPDSLTAVATLTNNSSRGMPGTNPRTGLPNPGVDEINPRGGPNTNPPGNGNPYGHIVTWSYRNDWTEDTFRWDIYVLAGNPAAAAPDGSNVDGDIFGSPDGIYVAPSGRLWIQTDVSGSSINPESRAANYVAFGNNQMLCSDPATGEVRRFLTGPNVSEITGVFVTPDETAMFVGIQHPGEAPTGANDPANPKRFSSWPDGPAGQRPRSATVLVTKDDGGPIGS
ncbi:MAG: PhoX family phosphatase [Actinomycetota bacterium]|nr:PhoX family phosphatase [Acidimicrobiia bacterium]MDQ3293654.1 PhoX family phosphatase [Actinomycetota bacterium]